MKNHKEKAERIYGMIESGTADESILRQEKISAGTLSAYKANYTRRQEKKSKKQGIRKQEGKIGDSQARLVEYMQRSGKPGIYIPNKNLTDRLRPNQVSQLVQILDTVFSDSPAERTQRKETDSKYGGKTKEQVIEIIGQLLDGGKENSDIYRSPRLVGVSRGSITAIIATYSRGGYDE